MLFVSLGNLKFQKFQLNTVQNYLRQKDRYFLSVGEILLSRFSQILVLRTCIYIEVRLTFIFTLCKT